jgi:nucleoside 2-deoxyribosyltransferase
MSITAEYVHGMDPAPGSEPLCGDGRIPFTFRIGVTGHRELDTPDELRRPIREAIVRLLTLVTAAPGAGLALVVVSALAEGADRLVAEEVLAAGAAPRTLQDVLQDMPTVGHHQKKVLQSVLADLDARLEVALPMAAEEYAKDFTTEESKEEFRCFLARAQPGDIWEAPAERDREEAYERAGRYVVDRCDAIIAVWDGEKPRGRGGTAEIVGYAQEQGIPIAWVHSVGGPEVSYALENERAGVAREAAGKLRRYNAAQIGESKFGKRLCELRKELMPDIAREIPLDPLGLSRETIADWVFPYFIRADILALRYQRQFRWLSLAVFVLAALAVAVVALQTNFWPALNWLAAFEVVFLGTLLGILMMNRRLGLHDKWISSRFLAERLRSSYFLALAKTGDQRERSPRLAYLSDSSEAWIERALTEVSARRPELNSGSPPVRALRDYLARYWIQSQISYQEKTSGRHHALEHRLIRATELLFLVTLAAAFVHIFSAAIFPETGKAGLVRHGFWEGLLIVVSIAVPAFGAAVHGFGTQRQFRRHSERYQRMAGVLGQVQAEMTDATTIEQVQDAAAATERVMREENSDWFGVMRFHDMELIT